MSERRRKECRENKSRKNTHAHLLVLLSCFFAEEKKGRHEAKKEAQEAKAKRGRRGFQLADFLVFPTL